MAGKKVKVPLPEIPWSENSHALRKVNALKISANDTDIGEISAVGTDLVGTSFQCHSHGTDFQYAKSTGTDM